MLLLPAFPRPPPHSPHSPLHSRSTRRTTKINGVSSSTVTATSLPDAKPSKLLHSQAACVWAPAYVSTERGVNYKRGNASGGGPTGGDQRHWRLKKKRQRQKHAHHWQQFTRAQFPGGRFPAKFGCQPIKLELYPLAHT